MFFKINGFPLGQILKMELNPFNGDERFKDLKVKGEKPKNALSNL